MEVDMGGIILQYVKIMTGIGIHMMTQIALKPQKKKFVVKVLMFFFIEEGIGNIKLKL
jgi:hypothetical protein